MRGFRLRAAKRARRPLARPYHPLRFRDGIHQRIQQPKDQRCDSALEYGKQRHKR